MAETTAQQYQKDYAQFYTPQSIVKFMWKRCMGKEDLDAILEMGRVPRVFDPCMGIGTYLCEFLTRLIDQGSEIPLLWNEPTKLKLTTKYDSKKKSRENQEWKRDQLQKLRDPKGLRFDYVATNPPYMIRKTGFVADPDPELYDKHILKRAWIWQHFELLEIFQFEPYKVWPKLQTDSIIFKMRKRTPYRTPERLLFLRHMSGKYSLERILQTYDAFDKTHLECFDPLISYKLTSTVLHGGRVQISCAFSSFSHLSPTSSVSNQLMEITKHLPRLCDRKAYSDSSSLAPLVWNRGPNTNPVYAMVVRTHWAIDTFGTKKRKNVSTYSSKEGSFWEHRDPLRLCKKEASPAEAYTPFHQNESNDSSMPFYSLILVDREDAHQIEKEHTLYGDNASSSALYHYLLNAKMKFQTNNPEIKIAYCHYRRSGIDAPVKIVHPINVGYFSRTQPRQRFFIDRDRRCQGRTRFFGKHMAKIPFSLPRSKSNIETMTMIVEYSITVRQWIYSIVRISNALSVIDQVRRCTWKVSVIDQAFIDLYERLTMNWRTNLCATTTEQANWVDIGIRHGTYGKIEYQKLLLKKIV
ncbi:hypothetical protein BDF14DRAFT_1881785 [Spinellus fusiger]|nr:hypothetical protein BDF14DRAFT_1881785 [Spinellus fusiger]